MYLPPFAANLEKEWTLSADMKTPCKVERAGVNSIVLNKYLLTIFNFRNCRFKIIPSDLMYVLKLKLYDISTAGH